MLMQIVISFHSYRATNDYTRWHGGVFLAKLWQGGFNLLSWFISPMQLRLMIDKSWTIYSIVDAEYISAGNIIFYIYMTNINMYMMYMTFSSMIFPVQPPFVIW